MGCVSAINKHYVIPYLDNLALVQTPDPCGWIAIMARMTGITASTLDLFKGRHFDREVIVLCVRWYVSFKLSSRDLVQMISARGIAVTQTTILPWVQRYVPDFEKCWS
jgi:hypothetical protein